MKLTKYQHACFVVEHEGRRLVVDPGTFAHDFIVPTHVDAIVITHEHPDHLDESKVKNIFAANPQATLIAHESIAGKFTEHATIGAQLGEPYAVGTFNLRFFSGQHATIVEGVPAPPNLSVLINDRLYYPGDSFFVPQNISIKELAVPASAPWLKIRESMQFLGAIKPAFAFPTHDGILSADGKALADQFLGTVASGQNTHYKRLDGQTITLS